jgi:glucose-1-phosphate thymidylyltransferase
MNVVILCAGFATRMYPLTKHFPKPLLEAGGKPVLDYFIDQIVVLPEIQSIHIVSNDRFFDHFKRWHHVRQVRGTFGSIPVSIHNDGTTDNDNRRGAAGDLQLALNMIGAPSSVLVSGGDNIYCFSLKPLWETFHTSDHHYIVALPETREEKLQKTGVLELSDNNRVTRLHEKPARPPSHWVCPPLYFFQPSVGAVLDSFLQTSANHDAPGHFIDFLCQREEVEAFRLESRRLDIGSIDSYQEADRELREGGVNT